MKYLSILLVLLALNAKAHTTVLVGTGQSLEVLFSANRLIYGVEYLNYKDTTFFKMGHTLNPRWSVVAGVGVRLEEATTNEAFQTSQTTVNSKAKKQPHHEEDEDHDHGQGNNNGNGNGNSGGSSSTITTITNQYVTTKTVNTRILFPIEVIYRLDKNLNLAVEVIPGDLTQLKIGWTFK